MDAKIKEAYVSFEVAKLLKEKGFTEECEYFYDWYKDSGSYHICSNGGTCNSEAYPDEYSMPTQQMAMAWCREVHKLYINIWADPKDVESNDFDIIFRAQVYNGPSNYGTYEFSTYEEACEASIKYCLEKWI